MTARALMIQGDRLRASASRLLVAGLCRLARRRGIRVAPFKPQNMSNNAAVCVDGGEIGRAQALQARAAGLGAAARLQSRAPEAADRPRRAGRRTGPCPGRLRRQGVSGRARRGSGRPPSRASNGLAADYELVLVEGAGSPRGGEPAAERHRQHGLRARRPGACLPGGRHRSRRRNRVPRRHPGGAGSGGRGACFRIRGEQVPGRPGTVR